MINIHINRPIPMCMWGWWQHHMTQLLHLTHPTKFAIATEGQKGKTNAHTQFMAWEWE